MSLYKLLYGGYIHLPQVLLFSMKPVISDNFLTIWVQQIEFTSGANRHGSFHNVDSEFPRMKMELNVK